MNEQTGWDDVQIGDIFRLQTRGCLPGLLPDVEFVHYSLPAYDELGGPIRQLGVDIESGKIVIDRPCILVSKLNPRILRVARVETVPGDERHCASTEFMVYEPKSDEINLGFFSRLLAAPSFQRRLTAVATGTTNSHIRVRPTETLRWQVPVPPPGEQRRISEILDTVAKAISSTEQLIAKLEHIKRGMLHDLLTRGIGEKGSKRPKTPQAELPPKWEIRTLGDLATFAAGYGFPDIFQGGHDGEIPFFKVSDMASPGNERWLRVANHYVSAHTSAANGWRLIQPPGIAFAKVGAALRLNKRRMLNSPSLVDNNMLVAQPKADVDVYWLYLWLSDFDLGSLAQEGALPSVNQGQLARVKVAFPPIAEQRMIGSVCALHERRAAEEMKVLSHLRFIQAGLVNDLLTGRVRVTVGREEVA